VRYRLGRVAEVTGLDVRNFDALLTARLALGILDLSCEAG
jgi:DNA-binding PucR family transcriptional regulator